MRPNRLRAAVLVAVTAAASAALYQYDVPPPFQDERGRFVLSHVIVVTDGTPFFAPWYLGDSVSEAAAAFCTELNAVKGGVELAECRANVERVLMERCTYVATRAEGTARALFGADSSEKARGGVLMSLHYAVEELSGRAADLSANAGQLLSFNKRLARMETAVVALADGGGKAGSRRRGAGVPANTPTNDGVSAAHAHYRPDGCSHMYSTYERTALNDVDARPGLRVALHGIATPEYCLSSHVASS
jgi:hypothetical protein